MTAIQGIAYIVVGLLLAAAVLFRVKRSRTEASALFGYRRSHAIAFWWWSVLLAVMALCCLIGGGVTVLRSMAALQPT